MASDDQQHPSPALALLEEQARQELEHLQAQLRRAGERPSPESGDAPTRAALHLRAAQLWLSSPNQGVETRQAALAQLWAGWQLDPANIDLRTLLVRCLEAEDQREEIADLYRNTAPHVAPAEGARLLATAAGLLLDATEVDEALDTLTQLSAAPADADANAEARRLLRLLLGQLPAGASGQRERALQLLLPLVSGRERASLLLELAQLLLHGGHPEDAAHCMRQALTGGAVAADALAPLARALEQQGHHQQQLQLLELAVAHAAGADRLAHMRQLAQLLEHQGDDLQRAATCWWQVWGAAPDAADPAEALKRIYAKSDDWADYGRVLQHQIDTAHGVASKRDALLELTQLQLEALHDPQAALATIDRVLQLFPDDVQALEQRAALLQRQGRKRELVRTLQRLLPVSSDERRQELLRTLARLQLDLDRRPELLRTVQQLDLNDGANRSLLQALLAEEEAEPGAMDLSLTPLAVRAEQATAGHQAAAAQLALRFARRRLDAGDVASAALGFHLALAAQPDHREARQGLRELALRDIPADGDPAPLCARARTLQEHDPTGATLLLVQAAAVMRHHRPDEAAAARQLLEQAAELCPPDEPWAMDVVEDALREAEMPQTRAQLLRRRLAAEAGDSASPGQRAGGHLERRKVTLVALAQLLQHELDQPDEALELLMQARRLIPDDVALNRQLQRVHAERGNHRELAEISEDLLALTEGRDRVTLLRQLGQLYSQHLNDEVAALSRYAELLAILPADEEALAYCRANDEAAGNHRSVAVLLCRAAEAADSPQTRAALHREIAEIAEQRLEDLEFALTHWRRVLELTPEDDAPLVHLRRLMTRLERWSDLERLLLSQIARGMQPERKVPLYLELARLSADKLGQDQRALEYLRNALLLAPGDPSLLQQLEEGYERLGLWSPLADALARHADQASGQERAHLRLRRAQVLFNHLGRDEAALTLCQEVADEHPALEQATALCAAILRHLERWEELRSLLLRQLEQTEAPADQARLHLQLGQLLREQPALSPEEAGATAVTHLEQALELTDSAEQVLPLLREHAAQQQAWDQLARLLEQRASNSALAGEERAAALTELGQLREQQLGAEDADAAYERALELNPMHRPALQALRRLRSGQGRWDVVVQLMQRELELTGDPRPRAALLTQLAQIQLQQQGAPEEAMRALEQSLELDPHQTDAALSLGTLSFQQQRWADAQLWLQQVVEGGEEVERLYEVHFQLGAALEQLGRADEAFTNYVKSFGREPMHLPTLERLAELCFERRQWDNTVRICEAIIGTYAKEQSPETLAELHMRCGLAQLHLSQQQVAVQRLQALTLEGAPPQTPQEAWIDAAERWSATPLERQLSAELPAETMSQVVRSAEQVLQIEPQHSGALQLLAGLALQRNDLRRALRFIDRAVASPRCSAGHGARLLLAAGDQVLAQGGDIQRARALYLRARELAPDNRLLPPRLRRVEGTMPGGAPPSETGPQRDTTPTTPPAPPPAPTAVPTLIEPGPTERGHDSADPADLPTQPFRPRRPDAPAVTPKPAPRSLPKRPTEE